MMSDESKMKNLDKLRNYSLTLSKDAFTLALAHFYRANYWADAQLGIGLVSTVASVFAGASILSKYQKFELVVGGIAVLASVAIALSTFLNPNKRSVDHYNAATSYLNSYYNALFFYEVESKLENKSHEDLVNKLSELTEKHNDQDKRSPRTPSPAYEKGKEASNKHFEEKSL